MEKPLHSKTELGKARVAKAKILGPVREELLFPAMMSRISSPSRIAFR
jgi:hypothetical protein